MKVFISWSGNRSKQVAEGLRDWLPVVIQVVKPWMSDPDMMKGVRWMQQLTHELQQTNVGIFCLTKENLNSRWINFEAGAISKSPDALIWTYLIDLKHEDVDGPLYQFHHSLAKKEETRKLVMSVNHALGRRKIHDNVVNTAFENSWPDLQKVLEAKAQRPARNGNTAKQSVEKTVKETFNLIRQVSRDIDDLLARQERLDRVMADPAAGVAEQILRRDIDNLLSETDSPLSGVERERAVNQIVRLIAASTQAAPEKRSAMYAKKLKEVLPPQRGRVAQKGSKGQVSNRPRPKT